MQKKSIAIVAPELLPVPAVKGGAVEYWIQEASSRLAKSGHKVSVISRPAYTSGNPAVQYLSVTWTATEHWFHSIKEKVSWRNPLRYLAKFQNVYSYANRVASLVQNHEFVYVHNEPNILLFLKKKPGQKIVLHMHNDHLSSRLLKSVYRRSLKKVDCVICVSEYIRSCAIAAHPKFRDKFQAILNVTDPSYFRPSGETAYPALAGKIALDRDVEYVMYAGRLAEIKGVHILIQAFQRIHAKYPNTKLVITGSSFFSGAARTAYQEKLVDLSEAIKEAIVFTGYLPHEDLRHLYSAVDIVVFPSVWQEPFGLVAVEAMASGTCLVASRVGGVPEIVDHNVDGLLVEPNDPEALFQAIEYAMTHPLHRQDMEYAARQKIETKFNWDELVKKLNRVFEELK